MTIAQHNPLSQLRDITSSRNYYYFRNTTDSTPFNKERFDPENPCVNLRKEGSIKFEGLLPRDGPAAVIVDITRKDCQRGKPEIVIFFRDDKTTIGLMCELASEGYDKIFQAISRNPNLLSQLFRTFDRDNSVDLSVPPRTSIQKYASTITFNEYREELEVNLYPVSR